MEFNFDENTHSLTHPPQIVDSRAAPFAAKNVALLIVELFV